MLSYKQRANPSPPMPCNREHRSIGARHSGSYNKGNLCPMSKEHNGQSGRYTMYKPYVVKRCRSRRTMQHRKSELARILTKEEKRSQWEQRRAETLMVEEVLQPRAISL